MTPRTSKHAAPSRVASFESGVDDDVVELTPCPAVAPSRLHEVAFRADAWLPHEIAQLRAAFAIDDSLEAIAAGLGRPRAGVASKIYDLGLRRQSRRPWSEFDDAALARDYGTMSAATIAGHLGRAVTSIYARAQLLGLSEPAAPPWSAWEDAQLREGYARDLAVTQLAALIGRPPDGLTTRASKLGLRHPSQPADWSSLELARMLELAESGMRYLAIIEQLVIEGYPRRSKAGLGPKLRAIGYGRGWGRGWTDDEDALLRHCYATGASLTPLRARLGRSRTSTAWRTRELGLQGTHAQPNGFMQGRVWTDAETDRLREAYGKVNSRELAAELGRDLRAMYTRAFALGLKHGWMRDFTAQEDAEIRAAWTDGTPLRVLAQHQQRDPAVISKHAIRLGCAFNSPDRPVQPQRGRKRGARTGTAAAIPTSDDADAETPSAAGTARKQSGKTGMAGQDGIEADSRPQQP